jgi:transcriptional regulator with XRE-family HTH domain
MTDDENEVARLLNVLRTLLRMLGISNREVERRSGLSAVTVTRVFSGQVEAKIEHLLAMARAAGLGYGELFYFAYPERFDPKTASPAAQTIVSMLEGLHPSQSRLGPPPSYEPPVPEKKEDKGKAEGEEVPADLETVVRRVMQEIRRQQPQEEDGPKAGNGSEEP